MYKNITLFKTLSVTVGAVSSAVLFSFLVGSTSAQALSCSMPESNTDFVASGGVIFVGTVISNNATAITGIGTELHDVKFNVHQAWGNTYIQTPFTAKDTVPAGNVPPYDTLQDPWGLRATFEVGKKYIVYASQDNSGFYKVNIGACASSGEYSYSSASQITSELGIGNGYTPSDPVPTDNPSTNGLLVQIQKLLELVASLQAQLRTVEETPVPIVVTNFAACVAVTGVVLESYPKKCVYGGRTYIEIIKDPVKVKPSIQCPHLTKGIGRGSSGASEKALQKFLTAIGDFKYPEITGYYGALTADAVKVFQCRELGVCFGNSDTTGYGYVGPQTRKAIKRICGEGNPVAPIACTQEAKICPDGSAVGRTGPSCQFAACPSTLPVACTMEYSPVCGQKQVQCFTAPCNSIQSTYGNACSLRAAGATYLYEGQCRVDINKEPVIHSFTGPTTLKISQTGTWRISASNTQNGSLSYKIDWGESNYSSPYESLQALADSGFVQNTTFTHSYGLSGVYTVTVTVRDNQGFTAKTTSTVRVDSGVVMCPENYAPVCGIPIFDCPAGADCQRPLPQTYGNVCQLTAVGAQHLYAGACASLGYTPVGQMCENDGQAYVEGSKLQCITSIGAGFACISDGSYVCRSSEWKVEGANGGPTCTSGSTYGGGYYETCDNTNILSVFEPSGGYYTKGDNIRVRWDTNVSNSDAGMYLVLEDSTSGNAMTSVKVNYLAGVADISTGGTCNEFFSDGLYGGCENLQSAVDQGKTNYRIRAAIYTPSNHCFGFCASGSNTALNILVETRSSVFTITN